MHRAQVFLERNGAHHGRHHHVAARLQIARFPDRCQQRACGNARAFQGNAVAQRMPGRREIAFNVVRQRVHAGGGRDVRRQAEREFGVGKHGFGQDFGTEHHALEVGIVFAENAGSPHFRAGARSRGQGDKIRQFARDVTNAGLVPGVLQNVALMGGGQADHFGYVECRTAAKTDHAVGLVCLKSGAARHRLAAGRVAEHAGEHRHLQPRQMGSEFCQYGQRRQRPVGDDQRAFQTRFKQVRSHPSAGSRAEMDGGGKGKGGDAHDGGS